MSNKENCCFVEFDKMIARSRLSKNKQDLAIKFSCFCEIALFGKGEDKKTAFGNLEHLFSEIRLMNEKGVKK